MTTTQENVQQIADNLRRPVVPQEFPPWGAYVQDFQDIVDAAFTPIAGTANWTTVRSYTVPAQKRAMVAWFGMTVMDLTANMFIRWRFLVNQAPLMNYQASPVNFVGIGQPGRVWIQVDQENTLTLQVGNVSDTAGWRVCTRFVLWTWDATLPPVRR